MRCVLFFLCMAASYSVEAKYNNNALLKNTGKAIWLLAHRRSATRILCFFDEQWTKYFKNVVASDSCVTTSLLGVTNP